MSQATMVDPVETVVVEIRDPATKETIEDHHKVVVALVQEEAIVIVTPAIALEDPATRDRAHQHLPPHAVVEAVQAKLDQAAALTAVQEQRAEAVNQKHPSKTGCN